MNIVFLIASPSHSRLSDSAFPMEPGLLIITMVSIKLTFLQHFWAAVQKRARERRASQDLAHQLPQTKNSTTRWTSSTPSASSRFVTLWCCNQKKKKRLQKRSASCCKRGLHLNCGYGTDIVHVTYCDWRLDAKYIML